MKWRPSLLALATVAIAVRLSSPSRVDAREWKQVFDRLPAEFTIDNPGPAVAPTIYEDLTIHHRTHRVYDMVMSRDITDELKAIELPPGAGKVLLIGTQVDFEADCRLIDAERKNTCSSGKCGISDIGDSIGMLTFIETGSRYRMYNAACDARGKWCVASAIHDVP